MTKAVLAPLSRLSLAHVAAAVLIGCAALTPASALNTAPAKPKPKPTVDCTKKANKTKPECLPGLTGPSVSGPSVFGPSTLSDDELYNAAYLLSRQGNYASSLALLKQVKNPDVPRVLNATGFATRKLGDIDAAFPYYARALALDPNYTRAREYLGEAHLSKGDLASAKIQLNEIASRCGTSCSGYPELASQIAAFEAAKQQGNGTHG